MKSFQEKLQTFAGAMMSPIILLVLVGFFVGVGAAFTNYILPENSFLYVIFDMFVNLGFMFMNWLPLWFAVGIAFTLAKQEKGWAAFAGVVLFFSFLTTIKTYAASQGWTQESIAVDNLLKIGYSEQEALNFNAIWGNVCGVFAYNMGIFSGIISGVMAAWIHNRNYKRKFNQAFAFFQGTKFVIILASIWAIPLGIASYYIWPIFASGLQALTGFITRSGLFGTWLFGFMDKALLPFGLHHLIAFPIEYSAVGGSMVIDGVVYEGVRNIINGQAASAEAVGYITRNFTTGRVLFQLAGLPGAAYAMYKCAKPENRKRVASLLIPAVLTLALVGISEPIEYTFLFVSSFLFWLVYAPLCGLCYVVAEVAKISINGNALFFMIPNIFQPQKVHALPLIFLLPLTFFVYYFAFKFMIVKFNLKTPGRGEAEEIKLMSKKEYKAIKASETGEPLELRIISAFGGPNNMESVTCCATRLRVVVKDSSKVVPDDYWHTYLEAMGCSNKGNSYQIIYGLNVNDITRKVKAELDID